MDNKTETSRRGLLQGALAASVASGVLLREAMAAQVSVTPKTINRQWIFKTRPKGQVSLDNFEYREVPLGDTKLGANEIIVHHKVFTVVPSQRVRMDTGTSFENGYLPPFPTGEPLSGGGVAEVVLSSDPKFPVGALVQVGMPWTDYSRHSTAKLAPPLPAGVTAVDVLGTLGGNAQTAYFGLLRVGELKEGETVVVSGASGSVGSSVMQIARIKKCKTIGIAGGADKCARLVSDYGAFGTIDYKSENIAEKLKKLVPEGVDVYYDNVGGTISQDVIDQMRKFGRVTLCGAISSYDKGELSPGPRDMLRCIMFSVKMQGFLLPDFSKDRDVALNDLRKWKESGQLTAKIDMRKGFKNIPTGFFSLFSGEKDGQLLIENG